MKKYKIVVRGGYGFSNFGDDALMLTLYLKLQELENLSNIAFLCEKNSYLENITGPADIISFKELNEESFRTKLLIYGGGTQFYSFRGLSATEKVKMCLKNPSKIGRFLKHRIQFFSREKAKDNKFGIASYSDNISALGIGLGPFEADDNTIEERTKILFKKMDFIAVRDPYALKKCEDWNITTSHQYPDICFSLKSEYFKSRAPKVKVEKIGIIIRDWKHDSTGRMFYENLLQEAENLRVQGNDVIFICFDPILDNEWLKILDQRNEDYLIWNPEKNSIDSFLSSLCKFDLFITARFHGAVFAALLEKPFIAIEVEQKLKMIANTFRGGAFCWNKPFQENKLSSLVRQIDEKYPEYVQTIAKKKNLLVVESNKMFQEFEKYYSNL